MPGVCFFEICLRDSETTRLNALHNSQESKSTRVRVLLHKVPSILEYRRHLPLVISRMKPSVKFVSWKHVKQSTRADSGPPEAAVALRHWQRLATKYFHLRCESRPSLRNYNIVPESGQFSSYRALSMDQLQQSPKRPHESASTPSSAIGVRFWPVGGICLGTSPSLMLTTLAT